MHNTCNKFELLMLYSIKDISKVIAISLNIHKLDKDILALKKCYFRHFIEQAMCITGRKSQN